MRPVGDVGVTVQTHARSDSIRKDSITQPSDVAAAVARGDEEVQAKRAC
ncbi:hypothetical protein [Actinomadura keratinilytica]|uniref:Uncharacterized protein n=1 Tax=Actinomadura keratinilytica TaxID=547461 RepID=A0ABP7YAS0_9ACTN